VARQVKFPLALARPHYVQADEHLPQMARLTERPPPDTGIFSDCGKVSTQWRKHITGVLDQLTDMTLWAGNDAQKYFAFTEIMKLEAWLYACGEGEEMPQLRQNPIDPCQLQQLVNDNWVLAFDYGLCFEKVMPKYTPNEIGEAIQEVVPPTNEVYDDIVQNGAQVVYPNTGNSPQDPQNTAKNDLLCAVITDYLTRLESYVRALLVSGKTAPTGEDFFESAGKIVASAFAIVTTIFVPLPIKFLTWLARAGAGVNFAVQAAQNAPTVGNYLNNLRTEIFNSTDKNWSPNTEEIKEMACAMYDAMKDKPITESNFNAGVQAIFAPEGIFDSVIQLYRIIMQGQAIFAEFITMYSQGLIAQSSGANFDNEGNCDCDEPPLVCGFNYQWAGVEVIPENITQYQAIPLNTVAVVIPIVVLAWQQVTLPPVENQFRQLFQVYELPCDKPITLMWARGNGNSAQAHIQTFDGTDWVTRASGFRSVGGVGGQAMTVTWANSTSIVYAGARVYVQTSVPYIIQFRIG